MRPPRASEPAYRGSKSAGVGTELADPDRPDGRTVTCTRSRPRAVDDCRDAGVLSPALSPLPTGTGGLRWRPRWPLPSSDLKPLVYRAVLGHRRRHKSRARSAGRAHSGRRSLPAGSSCLPHTHHVPPSPQRARAYSPAWRAASTARSSARPCRAADRRHHPRSPENDVPRSTRDETSHGDPVVTTNVIWMVFCSKRRRSHVETSVASSVVRHAAPSASTSHTYSSCFPASTSSSGATEPTVLSRCGGWYRSDHHADASPAEVMRSTAGRNASVGEKPTCSESSSSGSRCAAGGRVPPASSVWSSEASQRYSATNTKSA